MYRIILIILSTLLTGFLILPDTPPSPVHAYPEQLPGTYTGGFGEESCHSCHFDYPLNPDEGSLNVEGIPATYDPGKTYDFAVETSREDLAKAGFQLSARFSDSTQAGSFSLESERLEFTNSEGTVQYVQHSAKGTEPDGQTSNVWSFKWTAPEEGEGTITFNLAANAANGDASEFGDYIFLKKVESKPKSTN